MIGAGAVATRLLAGAWFGFELIWVALAIIPMVIVTLDSASRVGILSRGRGMLERVRSEIAPWLAWAIFLPTALVNVVVNMSQMSAMVEGTYGALGMLPPPTETNAGLVMATIGLTATTVVAAVLGGYKRVEKIMTALLLVILACFIIVAIKGLARLADVAGAWRRPGAAHPRGPAGRRQRQGREAGSRR